MRESHLYENTSGASPEAAALKVAICFPGNYRVGMANLGFLWVRHLANSMQEVRCDRFFMTDRQLNKKTALFSPDSHMTLADYDVVAFALPYEPGYLNVPAMLDAGGIPALASTRSRLPLVVAGGMAVSANPEPMSAILDAVLIGEAEGAWQMLLEKCMDYITGGARKARRGRPSESFFRALASEGPFYVPSLYDYAFDGKGITEITDIDGGPPLVIESNYATRIDAAHSPLITDGSAFPGMFLAELTRGCPHRCRFCLAGHTGGKFRIAEGAADAVALSRGKANGIGLIGTAFTRSPDTRAICAFAVENGMRVSFSSVRLDAGTTALMREFSQAVSMDTVTIAPETATDRLGAIVGKNIFAEMESFADAAREAGVKRVRMYYLIGVPGETDGDVAAIAAHAKSFGVKSGCEVMVSATPLIPKPMTPMQWFAFADVGDLKRKRKLLKNTARKEGLEVKVEGLAESFTQAVLARGDRRLSPLIAACADSRHEPFENMIAAAGLDASYWTRALPLEAMLPWSTVRYGLAAEELEKIYMDTLAAVK